MPERAAGNPLALRRNGQGLTILPLECYNEHPVEEMLFQPERGCGGIGRRTSLRSWRATVGVQVPSSAYLPDPV